MNNNRARAIVKLAANYNGQDRDWFRRDENGAWEREATRILGTVDADKVRELNASEDDVNRAVAAQLVLLEVDTRIRNMKARK